MKKLLTTWLLISMIAEAKAQENDSNKVNLDLLRAPNSPAATILGFATSDIEKPSDVSSFMLSLQSATSNFTALPSNYAVDLAPFWLFRTKGLTTDKMNSTSFNEVFKQTFVFSAGVRSPDSASTDLDSKNFYNSFGIKFSIVRGHYNDKTEKTLNAIGSLQKELASTVNKGLQTKVDSDQELKKLEAERKRIVAEAGSIEEAEKREDYKKNQGKIDLRMDAINQELTKENQDLLKKLKDKAKDFKIERYGFFIDFAGGTSLEYVDKKFDKGRIYNVGGWLTFGNNGEKGFSVLGLIRYLYNPDKVFADDAGELKEKNLSTLDGGGRLVYSNPKSRFSFSSEAIYRSVLDKNVIDPSWRLVFNADYDIGNNQKLTFSFGRAFDGTISKDGNIIAALNFLKGFGNKR